MASAGADSCGMPPLWQREYMVIYFVRVAKAVDFSIFCVAQFLMKQKMEINDATPERDANGSEKIQNTGGCYVNDAAFCLFCR
jgi:hypothetical protein